jgi:osmotically inducible protein OsmC
MAIRTSNAQWNGDLKSGKGTVELGSGAWEGQYSFSSRFEDGTGTNPEELVAAAHAGCYSMALANELSSAGFTADSVATKANVHLEMTADGPTIPKIDLITQATVPGIDNDTFQKIAEATKAACPISQLLKAAEITLDAKLNS